MALAHFSVAALTPELQAEPTGFHLAHCFWLNKTGNSFQNSLKSRGSGGLWLAGKVGRGQRVLWRDVSSRGLQNPALSAVASSQKDIRCPDSELISNVKPRTLPVVGGGWLGCLLLPFL